MVAMFSCVVFFNRLVLCPSGPPSHRPENMADQTEEPDFLGNLTNFRAYTPILSTQNEKLCFVLFQKNMSFYSKDAFVCVWILFFFFHNALKVFSISSNDMDILNLPKSLIIECEIKTVNA